MTEDIIKAMKESGVLDKLLPIIIDFLFNLILRLLSTVITFAFTMATVYAFGRMLEAAKTNKSRNTIALIVIIISSYFTSSSLTLSVNRGIILNTLFTIALSILAYVLIGFTLFSRVDNFFDKHFASDKPRVKRQKHVRKDKEKK